MVTLASRIAASFGGLILALVLTGAPTGSFNRNQKAFYADANTVSFVRPGLVISIVSADIAQDGTISTVFSVTDPKGAPLDPTGVSTPGAVALNFIAATSRRENAVCRLHYPQRDRSGLRHGNSSGCRV